MMTKLINIIKSNHLVHELLKGTWGLEKENIRVDDKGKMVFTPHPSSLGDKLYHPYITTDFSESQVEIITPPQKSMDEAYYMLENIHDIVSENLTEGEFLWPSSMPPIIPCNDDDIPIANYGNGFEAQKKMEYREYIAKKYGKHKQLISGIHYNFSFRESFIKKLHKLADGEHTLMDYKNHIYLTISRNLLKYQWLITYLLGANVATHSSYRHCCEIERHKKDEEYIFKGACSYRNSLCGYRNKRDFRVSFDKLDQYLKDLNSLIESGHLHGVNEYYSPVRLKHSKDNNSTTWLQKEGIEYLELRMIDLNPLTKVGINRDDLTLIHLIILSSLLYPCSSYNEEEQIEAILKQNDVSFNGHNLHNDLKSEGIRFFSKLKEIFVELGIENGEYNRIINNALKKLNGEEELYSQTVYNHVSRDGYINHHINVAKNLKTESINSSFSLKGYENLELSTQILMKEALLKGLKVDLLDMKENFISVSDGKKTEYIKQATKTSLDSYSTALVMENKAITKKVLRNSGIIVPGGDIYTEKYVALDDYDLYRDKKIVIKPNNTNFGIGITILNPGFSLEDYTTGLDLAFNSDTTILIEEFFAGNEYRFTIIDGVVRGILQRVPANVTGDGVSNISQLVEKKNQDPLRNKGYKTPLEYLSLGTEELMILKQQGLDQHSIIPEGEKVFLRENSNISTGGDSVDFTDLIHPSYREEAERAAQAVGANITGVDMIIEDISKERTDNNETIIELNFNPAIHIHCYPYKGKNRRLGRHVLNALGY